LIKDGGGEVGGVERVAGIGRWGGEQPNDWVWGEVNQMTSNYKCSFKVE
jgi:hypothetical protein